MEFKRLSKFQSDSREHCILLGVFYIMITMRSCVETLLTLWLCSGQIDPKKILFFPKILVNVIALDSNLLTLFT